MAHAIPIEPPKPPPKVRTLAEWQRLFPGEAPPIEFPEREEVQEFLVPRIEQMEFLELADELVGRIYEQFIPEDPTFRALVAEKPPVTFDFIANFADEDPEGFIGDLQIRGRTEDTELLLEMFGASEEDVTAILGPKVTVPEWLTLDFWKEALFRPYAGKDLATKAYASFVAGMGDLIVTTGGTARWLGYEEVGSTLSDIGSLLQRKAPPPTSGEFEFSDMMSPEFYATKVVRTIPFALSLAPLAIGGYYGGAAMAMSLGIRGIWARIIGGFAGGALSRPLESALEAGSTYDDAISRGKTEKEAKEEADEVFRNNMLLLGMDAFQIAIALAPTPKWVPSSLIKQGLVRTARVAGKMIIIGLSEGGEEVYQDMVQRHARDEEWKLDPVSKEVFAIGMAMGVLMGLGGDVIAGLVDKSKGKMSPKIKKEFEVAVSDSKAEGFNTQQSELQALEAISQTKEGEALVQEALREQRAEVPEVVPEITPEVSTQQLWDSLEVSDRVSLAKQAGLEEQVGSKVWADLSREEQDAILVAREEIAPAVPEVVPTKVAPVEPVIPEATEVIGEAGVPVPPEERLAKGVIDSSQIIKDMGLKEWVRSSRKVFEKMDLFTTYKGVQKAEILEGEEKAANAKARKKVAKTVDKNRREAVFDAVEADDVKGLTFEEQRAANFIRKFYDDWANRKGIPLEKRIGKYITHVFEEEMIAELKETGELSTEMAFMLTDKAKKTITDPFLKERLGAVGFIKDPFKAMEAYDAVSLRVFYYEPTLQKVAAIANDIETPQLFRNYFKSYTKRLTGEMSDVDKMTNNTLAEIAKGIEKIPTVGPGTFLKNQFTDMLTKGNPSAVMSHVVISWQYILWIGGKATSAIRNLSQNTLTISEVGPLAWGEAVGRIATKESRDVLRKSLGKRGRKLALVPGMDSDVVTNALDKFRNISMVLFRSADTVNVDLAVTGGYYEAKKILISANDALPKEWTDGKKRVSPERLDELILWRADEVMADTQYLYTKMNSMGASRSGLGRVLSMLTTWGLNWADLMTKWVSKRPSSVYLQFEKETGSKLPKKNWSQTNKAWMTYVAILLFAALIREETRLKAWEYTGITSLNYLANLVSGEFPGLQLMGAASKIATGVALGDDRQLNEGWRLLQATLMPGAARQVLNVAIGKRDWLTVFLYLKDKDFRKQKLVDKWKSETDKYPIFKDAEEREAYFKINPLHRDWSDTKIKQEWRKDNPLIEAKLFVINTLWSLSTDKARAEVLRLVEEHNLDTSMIRGYEKVWGVDIKKGIDGFKKRIGALELLEIGKEAKYFQTDEFARELDKYIKIHGKSMVLMVGDEFTKEYIEAKDLWVQYDNADSEGKKFLRNQFPDVEASLYFWGRISAFENPNSAVLVMEMMEKYGILPQGIKAFADDPARWDALQAPLFQLQLEWNDMLVEYENADRLERKRILRDNPKFRDARRHIEAVNKGIPVNLIEDYVAYYALSTEVWFARERFLVDHDEFYQMMTESGALKFKDLSLIPSKEYMKSFEEYTALETREEKQDYIDKNPKYRQERRRQDAYSLGFGKWDIESINMPALNEAIAILKKAQATHPTTSAWDIKWTQNYNVMIERLESAKTGVWDRDVQYEAYNLLLEDIILDRAAAERYGREGDTRRAKIYRDVVVKFEQVKEMFWAIFDVARASDRLVSQYVEYYEEPATGYRRERYLLENPEFAQIMHDMVGIQIPAPEDVLPEKWDEIYEKYKAEFDELLGIGDRDSAFYIEDLDNREEAREMMRFDEMGNVTPFFKAEKTLDAYSLKFPEEQIDNYVGYYAILAKGKPKEQDLWYEDDWYLMERPKFFKLAKELIGWDERDFSGVPTRKVFGEYGKYSALPTTGKDRLIYRHNHPELEKWFVEQRGYTPVGDRWKGEVAPRKRPKPDEDDSREEPFEFEKLLELP